MVGYGNKAYTVHMVGYGNKVYTVHMVGYGNKVYTVHMVGYTICYRRSMCDSVYVTSRHNPLQFPNFEHPLRFLTLAAAIRARIPVAGDRRSRTHHRPFTGASLEFVLYCISGLVTLLLYLAPCVFRRPMTPHTAPATPSISREIGIVSLTSLIPNSDQSQLMTSNLGQSKALLQCRSMAELDLAR